MALGQFAIDTLLDEVLLEIFACYVGESQERDAWHTLACVCRRWRSIIFGSPRRLNLRIFCSDKKPVSENLDSWPPFPIVLTSDCYLDCRPEFGEENIFATLKHHDRVCDIEIWNFSSSLWEKVLPLMQKPFPILTDLNLRPTLDKMVSVVPDLFLGGSAIRLRKLKLGCIPFPGLPKLLLSATHLVHLELYNVPVSGYIAPEAMVTCLSTLTRLQFLRLHFQWPLSIPEYPEWERRHTSLSTRTLLPSLTCFIFQRSSKYLEDFVDKIDVPQLNRLKMGFDQLVFDTPRLAYFISRVPKLKTCNEVRLRFNDYSASVKVYHSQRQLPMHPSCCNIVTDDGHIFSCHLWCSSVPPRASLKLSSPWRKAFSSMEVPIGNMGQMKMTLAYIRKK